MIKFFYSEDTFSIAAAVKQETADFVASEQNDYNLTILDAAGFSAEKFSGAILSMPFLGKRKMVVLKNILLEGNKSDEEKILKVLKNIPDDTELVFAESGNPDARGALFKYLQKEKGAKKFLAVTPYNLAEIIKAKAEEEGVKINGAAVAKLSLYLGPDLWKISNEVKKLAAFARANGREIIEVADVEQNVEPMLELKIFDLTDALVTKNVKKSLRLLAEFSKAGEDTGMVFNMVIYALRNLIVVKDVAGKASESEIARQSGLHPFVVKKSLAAASKISREKLTNFYHKLSEVDWQMKTGQADLETSLTVLVVDFCGNDTMK